MRWNIVAAIARNGVIGNKGALPWGRFPADMQRFKELTMGHPVIMGRKTWDSIPPRFRPLPGRTNLVLTRQVERVPLDIPTVMVFSDIKEAMHTAISSEVFCIGGAEVYSQFLAMAPHFRKLLGDDVRLLLTHIDADYEGDVRFPELDLSPSGPWKVVAEQRFEPGTGGFGPGYRFVDYELK